MGQGDPGDRAQAAMIRNLPDLRPTNSLPKAHCEKTTSLAQERRAHYTLAHADRRQTGSLRDRARPDQGLPARALDAMLHAALPPVRRGVTRGTHEHFNRLDAARQIEAARRLNGA